MRRLSVAAVYDCRIVPSSQAGFTLIELIVVISIIAVLIGLLFPAFQGIQNQAKKTQAKNDLMQIVTAVNAFYTEYGQYPCAAQSGDDSADYFPATDDARKTLFDALRVPTSTSPPTLNPRAVAFLQLPAVKNDTTGQRRAGVGRDGIFYDPWGKPYEVKIDSNYNGTLANPYNPNTGAGPASITQGVVSWSTGKDGSIGKAGNKNFTNSDDVISWQ